MQTGSAVPPDARAPPVATVDLRSRRAGDQHAEAIGVQSNFLTGLAGAEENGVPDSRPSGRRSPSMSFRQLGDAGTVRVPRHPVGPLWTRGEGVGHCHAALAEPVKAWSSPRHPRPRSCAGESQLEQRGSSPVALFTPEAGP